MKDYPQRAAILVIGNEVLSGKVADENGPFAIKRLRKRGIALERLVILPDTLEDIIQEVRYCRHRFDYIFTSGGIGPTHDDLTIEAIAASLNLSLQRDKETEQKLRTYHQDRFQEAHLRMADFPEGVELLRPDSGWLSVIKVQNIYILPGIPALFHSLWEVLEPTLPASSFYGVAIYLSCAESAIADTLRSLQTQLPEIQIGSYPCTLGQADYRVKITCEGREEAAVETARITILEHLPKTAILRTEPIL